MPGDKRSSLGSRAGRCLPVCLCCSWQEGTPSCPNGNKYLPATGANEASCVWLKNLLQDPCQVPLLLVAAEKTAARAKA